LDVQSLSKKVRDGYSNCLTDIRDILCDLPFEQIALLDDLLFSTQKFQLRKIRVPNKELNYGKSSGYRIIALCNNEDQNIYLLCIYPKKGKLEQSDLTSNGVKLLLEKFVKAQAEKEIFVPICEEKKKLDAAAR
jgi:hypothetical protein